MSQDLDDGAGVEKQLESVSFLSCKRPGFSVQTCDTLPRRLASRLWNRQRELDCVPLAST